MRKNDVDFLLRNLLHEYNNFCFCMSHEYSDELCSYFKGRYEALWEYMYNNGLINECLAYIDAHINSVKDDDKDET